MKKLAAAATLCLVAGIAAPAYAHAPSPNKANKPHTTVSPKSGIHTGTVIHIKGTGGLKKADYSCILVILHHGTAGASTANLNSIVQTKSNKKGTFKCNETFKPFTGIDGGKTVHCPPTKAERKKAYSCGVGVFSGPSGSASKGSAKFKAKK